MNKSNKPPPVPSVDGVSGSSHISQLFSSKLDSLRPTLLSSLSADDLKAVSISEECIVDAFSHLKCGKSDGSILVSNHLLPAICSSLASLFTAILRHGYMPKPVRDCTIVPILKGNKDPSSSDNYRPIALAPTLSKALEWCILLSYPDHFLTLGLQFGFKQKMSLLFALALSRTLSLVTCMKILLSICLLP